MVWVMILGMLTLIMVTMIGAVMQVAGNIPDEPLLIILSRYLRRRDEPPQALLHPWEAASRLARLRWGVLGIGAAAAVVGVGLAIWATGEGWGTVAMLAITCWVIAANLLFASIAPATWRRRALRMSVETGEIDSGGQPPPREDLP